MAALTHGMNPDEVEGLGHRLKQAGDQITALINELNGRVSSTTWEGPDAQKFKQSWWPEHRTRLQQIATAVNGFGQSALNNATEQRPIRVETLERALLLASDVPGVTGRLKMNAKRNVEKPAVIQELVFTNGEVKYIYKTTINPN